MSESRESVWKKLAVEAVVIVGSILLAFWIDASWQDRQETQQGQELVSALAAEVAENQKYLATKNTESRDTSDRARRLLEVMALENQTDEQISEFRDLGNVFTMHSWSPDTDVYQQALSTGQLLLIRDSDLRFALANYYSILNWSRRNVLLIETQYYLELEPFMAKNTIYTDIAHSGWLTDTPTPPFSTDLNSLAKNRELWSLIALRLEAEIAHFHGIELAQKSGNELTSILQSYVN